MKIKNLTPHPLSIMLADGTSLDIPVDAPAPRLAVEHTTLGHIDLVDAGCEHDGGSHQYDQDGMPWPVRRIPIVRSAMGEPTGLPEPKDGTIVIVSALVAEHPSVGHRTDLAYPGEAIRDTDGKIVGAKGLCAGPGLAESLRSASV